jgi:hypothetical protein
VRDGISGSPKQHMQQPLHGDVILGEEYLCHRAPASPSLPRRAAASGQGQCEVAIHHPLQLWHGCSDHLVRHVSGYPRHRVSASGSTVRL